MIDEELVTHQQVLDWLPRWLTEELIDAMPPKLRGWWTIAEAEALGGEWVGNAAGQRWPL